MPGRTSADLLLFFKQIVNSQNAILTAKKQLQKCKNFDPSSLFQHIAGNMDAISIGTFKKYLQNRIACSDKELYTIFQKFDHSRLGYIICKDFVNELKIKAKEKSNKKYGFVTPQMQQLFRKLLTTFFKTESVLYIWRQELQQVRPYIFFQNINKSKTGVISKRQLFELFYYNDQRLNQFQVQILHRSLLRRTEKQLNLEAFCLNFNPLQFGYYSNYKIQLDHAAQVELKEKSMIAREAQQIQSSIQNQKRTDLIVSQVHKQAALSRELQLQKKIKDEIRAYQQLKFLTKKKYHPHISYQYFLHQQKENQNANLKFIQTQIQKAKIRQAEYKGKIRNVQAMIEVQRFQSGKNGFERYENERDLESRKQKLENNIRSHSFSRVNCQNLLLKRRVFNELSQINYPKVL